MRGLVGGGNGVGIYRALVNTGCVLVLGLMCKSFFLLDFIFAVWFIILLFCIFVFSYFLFVLMFVFFIFLRIGLEGVGRFNFFCSLEGGCGLVIGLRVYGLVL